MSDITIKLKQKYLLGELQPVNYISRISDSSEKHEILSKNTHENYNGDDIPEHLQELYERSSNDLDEIQKRNIKNLLLENSEVLPRTN